MHCAHHLIFFWVHHWCLELDDWKHNFSIHKLSLDELLDGGSNGCDLRRLLEPLLRLGFLTVGSYPCFHSVGSSIVVTSHWDRLGGEAILTTDDDHGRLGGRLTLVYDTETAVMDMNNNLPRELSFSYDGSHPTVAAGGRLYTFDSSNDGGLPYLSPTESSISHFDSSCFSVCTRPQRRWIWARSPVHR